MRGLELLACFGPASPELSLADCAERTGLDKATAYRLLHCLVEAGFLHRDAARGFYRVGPALLPIAGTFQNGNALAAIAEAHVRRMAAVTGQTATLAVREGATTVNILVAHSDRPLRRLSYVGERLPLHATSAGKVIAAHLRGDDLEALMGGRTLVQLTPNTITTASAFFDELERVRLAGYALDDEEAISGVRCLGAVVRDYAGQPVAAISVAGAAGEFEGESFRRYVDTVRETALSISTQLGFVPLAAVSE
ncbi:MAG: IclR family transcriptional regulator [Actinobacteria bacterium]|nr:IclR family transcriptional regulator [Actinomycetota bacterium]